MKIFLVNQPEHFEDGINEYETHTTIAAFTTKDKATDLVDNSKGSLGLFVEEMELDQEFRFHWTCQIAFNGKETGCYGPYPVLELPETRPDPWNTGCYGYGWTPEEARESAIKCYKEKIEDGYKKLRAEADQRQKEIERGGFINE